MKLNQINFHKLYTQNNGISKGIQVDCNYQDCCLYDRRKKNT